MRSRWLATLSCVVLAGGLLAAAPGSGRGEGTGGGPAEGGQAKTKAKTKHEPVTVTLPPIATFDQNCSRCHGPRGSFYGKGFADHPPAELRQVVKEMMQGPGGLDPTPPDVDAMAAYQRALRDNQPFVVVTNLPAFKSGKAKTLKGEVDERATLTATVDGEKVDPQQTGRIFKLTFDPAKLPGLKLTAKTKEQTTTLAPAKSAWSHRPKEKKTAGDEK